MVILVLLQWVNFLNRYELAFISIFRILSPVSGQIHFLQGWHSGWSLEILFGVLRGTVKVTLISDRLLLEASRLLRLNFESLRVCFVCRSSQWCQVIGVAPALHGVKKLVSAQFLSDRLLCRLLSCCCISSRDRRLERISISCFWVCILRLSCPWRYCFALSDDSALYQRLLD